MFRAKTFLDDLNAFKQNWLFEINLRLCHYKAHQIK